MLLFAFGFVSRTGFLYAAWRSAVVLVGFTLTALSYDRPGHLLIDAFILTAAVIGSLVALRLLERSRRQVFFQDVVITEQAEALRAAKERSEDLLQDVLPQRISARLLDGERNIADDYPSVSVLFADIVGFTALSARLRPDELIDLLDRLFTGFDALVAERDLEKIKTIGDAYMVAGGLAGPGEDHATRIVDLGLRMMEVAERVGASVGGLPLRIGVHTGPVIGGVLGHRRFAFDIWGDTVNLASRIESAGTPNRVHITEATRRLLADRFVVEALGPMDLRGHGPTETFAVVPAAI
jgi:class 3 adenylate cyclase